MSPRNEPVPAAPSVTTLSRRQILAVAASIGTVSLAGCSRVVEFIGGLAMEDVTVINGSEHSLAGSIVVTGPDGETRLDEPFSVGPQDQSDDENDETPAETDENTVSLFQDVLDDNGTYTVAVSLETDQLFDGETEETVTVSDPEEEDIIVFLQPSRKDAAVVIETVESFSDLERFDEEYDPEAS